MSYFSIDSIEIYIGAVIFPFSLDVNLIHFPLIMFQKDWLLVVSGSVFFFADATQIVRALYDFDARQQDELTIKAVS